jgi:cytochrome c peroxidase
MHRVITFFALLTSSVAFGRIAAPPHATAQEESGEEEGGAVEEAAEPAEVAIGERLFLETRFAQYFFAHAGGDMNATLAVGDPTVAVTATTGETIPGPFAGRSMNCRVCHLVDEHTMTPRAGNRTYADFARRSPVPVREDGHTTAVRNAPTLVQAVRPKPSGLLLHFDAEFPTMTALIEATLTGRNFGWLPAERDIAVAHIASVIRDDDGRGALARVFGGPYRRVLRGRSPALPHDLVLPRRLRIDVDRATAEQILDRVAHLIAAYLKSLAFARDEDGSFSGSPYDHFLERNVLPRKLRDRQSARVFTRDLRGLLARREPLRFVPRGELAFALHDQDFVFGPEELRGLSIFLREPAQSEGNAPPTEGGVGNCVACHPAPLFTDFELHNTGIAQQEYDALHGAGSFAALAIPDFDRRNLAPDSYLPPSALRPAAAGPFRAVASADRPGLTDLGAWNIYGNPDFPNRHHQRRLERAVCRAMGSTACAAGSKNPNRMLDGAVALFKTPGLRDLGHSGPYFHNGSADTLEDVIASYAQASELARAGKLRNAAPELLGIRLTSDDVGPLVAFLRALNEDYE